MSYCNCVKSKPSLVKNENTGLSEVHALYQQAAIICGTTCILVIEEIINFRI